MIRAEGWKELSEGQCTLTEAVEDWKELSEGQCTLTEAAVIEAEDSVP